MGFFKTNQRKRSFEGYKKLISLIFLASWSFSRPKSCLFFSELTPRVTRVPFRDVAILIALFAHSLFRNFRPKMIIILKFDFLTNGKMGFFLWYLWRQSYYTEVIQGHRTLNFQDRSLRIENFWKNLNEQKIDFESCPWGNRPHRSRFLS